MDESRKQRDEFEKWWEDEDWDKKLSNVQGVMFNRIKTGMFTAWTASRANVEINLPDIELVTDTLTAPGDGWEVYDAQKVDKALCDAGIKVKE